MTTFCDSSGRVIVLGNELGKGGEARVYRVVNRPNVAAKIYIRSSQTGVLAEKQAKLNTMLAIAPTDPAASQHHVSIAWPTETVYDNSGNFSGFLMPSVEAVGTLRDISNPSARRLRGLSGFTSIYLHRAAANVCHAVAAIHDVGHVIGDLNPNNVLVNRQSLATLIDTDSYQISNATGRVFRCGVGVPEYMAPERARGVSLLSSEQDFFALAILIFEMLMGGFHPYAGGAIIAVQSTAQLTTTEYMKQGLFPFARNAFAAPPDGAPDFQLLHAKVRDAFTRTFVYGNAAPNLRLTPREWAELVRRAENDLAPCRKNPEHYFYQSVGTCMWCEQEARINRLRGGAQQPMAVPVTVQIPLAAYAQHRVPPAVAPARLQPVASRVGVRAIVTGILLLALLAWLVSLALQPNAGTETAVSALAQFSQQGPKLLGTGAVGNDMQGISVSVSADGNTAIVGGPGLANSSVGAAWVWTRSGEVWTQQGAKLVGSGAVGNAQQGSSVAIAADGNTVIVGGNNDNSQAGAAWVWTRSGEVWTQQGTKLVGSSAVGNAQQGRSVALSADGNTAIVGGLQDNSNTGAAWVWTRSGGVWTQQGTKLVGSGAVGNGDQGISVALSADGNTAIVGGLQDSSDTGAAWVWTRNGGVWTQQGTKLVGSGAVGGASQGVSVSLSADGNTAIVGGSSDNSKAGAAWVWTRSEGVWTQQGNKLFGSGAVGGSFQGYSVSLSADGNMAIIGGVEDNGGAGAVWVWGRSGGAWTQQGNKLVGSGAVGSFVQQGISVSLSANGTTAIVGGYTDNGSAGATWVFAAIGAASTPTGQGPVKGRHDEEFRIAERARIEQGLAGIWSNGSSRLTITKDGGSFRAVYRFPSGSWRGEGHQTMHGQLLADNELKLSNIYVGKLANPRDYWPGDFSGETWIALGADGTYLTARFSAAEDGRSLVMKRLAGEVDSQVPALAEDAVKRIGDGSRGVNPRDGQTYVWIPSGTFQMGCTSPDEECATDEKPVHSVTISKGFWLGQTLVTRTAYERVMHRQANTITVEEFESTNWRDSQEYCHAIGMRLPTEAEWEYAAKSASPDLQAAELVTSGRHDANSGSETKFTRLYPPDSRGFHDLRGEVWQWVGDWYSDYYGSESSTDPHGPADGTAKVLRGGLRSLVDRPSVRGHVASGDILVWTKASRSTSMIVGFRCAGNDRRPISGNLTPHASAHDGPTTDTATVLASGGEARPLGEALLSGRQRGYQCERKTCCT